MQVKESIHTKEMMQATLSTHGITTEIVGDAIYRFSQYKCQMMVPQHIIDRMLYQDLDQTINHIVCKMFYLVRRIEE